MVQYVAGNIHLFDTLSTTWSQIASRVPSAAKLVPVRHTACMLEGTLHVIGGGAMCFSFGSTFSEVSSIPYLGACKALHAHQKGHLVCWFGISTFPTCAVCL